jgi:hypothetical protein
VLGVMQGDAPSSIQQTGGRRRPRLASDIRRQGRQGRMSLIQIADFDVSGRSSLTYAQGHSWLLHHTPLMHGDTASPTNAREQAWSQETVTTCQSRGPRGRAELVATGMQSNPQS